jgi:hypothetical protein
LVDQDAAVRGRGVVMANAILLLGAGFSKNWNGLLATEVTTHLMAHLQSDSSLFNLLNNMSFEDVLSQLQTEFLLLGKSRYAVQEARLNAFQAALSDIFDRMNKLFQSRQFEFSNDVSRSFKNFLTGFDAIFTLNQDLLLELHYRNEDAALWYGKRWQGWEMPGLRPLPVTDHLDRTTAKWRPEEPFQSSANLQPYYKLHGSSGWVTNGGQPLLVIGRDKTGTIGHHPILRWTYQQFEHYLKRDDTRLMVIGYGFRDDHINQSLIDAYQAGKLKSIYLVQPSGKAVMNIYPPGTIPGPQPLLDIPCIECIVPISAAFNGDDLARGLMQRIFQ